MMCPSAQYPRRRNILRMSINENPCKTVKEHHIATIWREWINLEILKNSHHFNCFYSHHFQFLYHVSSWIRCAFSLFLCSWKYFHHNNTRSSRALQKLYSGVIYPWVEEMSIIVRGSHAVCYSANTTKHYQTTNTAQTFCREKRQRITKIATSARQQRY